VKGPRNEKYGEVRTGRKKERKKLPREHVLGRGRQKKKKKKKKKKPSAAQQEDRNGSTGKRKKTPKENMV